ncbi:acyltransferase [Nocardiopsis sp. RSe5-2]|uniref:Acyltransferase n=1 Tax=Nocardiopsis endophytica TaxID=3018445 RepID=A0ABT4U8I7_9ACTN|nr:acyltransferase [Nocardiopsis endophytica]MDA2813264.1 acyltransferase [Nocardiopsis endophytica]
MTTPRAAERPSSPPEDTARRHLGEVQGLRGLAVSLVVVAHINSTHLTGGYIGVDVFFAVSGFIITTLLLREAREHGRVRLTAFYARRIRRILPAATLVLVTAGAASLALLPPAQTAETGRQLLASALFAENLLLASYHAPGVADFPAETMNAVAHYWSLATEEQFYLVWPLLVIGWTALPRRLRGLRTLFAAGSVLLLGSLAASALLTSPDGMGMAFYLSHTRLWELAAGCLLAVALVRLSVPVRVRAPLGWAGLAAILASAFLFDERTAFPGWIAAVPVLGTLAVIAAADSPGRWTAYRLLSTAPARFVGDVSYSLYLWHWPLIVFWPALTGGRLSWGWPDGLIIGVLSLLLAWGTKVLVEDPVRHGPRLRSPRAAAAFAAGCTLLIAALAWGMLSASGV